jgi:hypothetical protein
MAITYVGGVQGGRAGSTATTTQSLSATLSGGSDTSPSTGDLVVVWVSVGTANAYVPTTLAVSGNNSGAYTTETMQSADDTNDSYSQLSYIIQGGTVDTSLTIPSSGNIRNAQRWVVHVFRGVDSSIFDATPVPASGVDTGRPDPSAISPSTAGAWIVAFYASAAGAGTAFTAPTELVDWLGGTGADTYDCMQGGGYYDSWTTGSYNPQAITAGGTTGTGDSWTAMTIALKPGITQTTKTHTTDSALLKTNTKTHTTDSYLQVAPTQVTKTHTIDSYLYAQITKTHTTDSAIKKTDVKTHTTDSALKKTDTKTHTTDSLLKDTHELTQTTDSYLYGQSTRTHTTDSYLQASSTQYTISHTTDAALRKTDTKTHTTDSYLYTQNTKTHTTDSYLYTQNTKTHTTDSYLYTQNTKTHTTDSLLKDTHELTHATDSALSERKTVAHTIDSYLRFVKTAEHTTDSALRATKTTAHTTDAYLAEGSISVHHSTDSLLARITPPKKIVFDIETGRLLYRINDTTYMSL